MDDQIDYVGNNDAIDMAIQSGDLLYQQKDAIHDWALILIISNLFELVAEVEEPRARFEFGFKMIMGDAFERDLPFGWHPRLVAEAIRNMLDHGMNLHRRQTKNYHNEDRAEVESMGFIPSDEAARHRQVLFDIYEVGENKYILLVSPMLYWNYVQEWHKRRIAR